MTFLSVLILAASAGSARAASLAELAERAAARSAGREAMSALARQADEGFRQARMSRLPSLSARASAVRGDDPVYSFSTLLQQRAFTAQDFAVDRLNRPGYRTNMKASLEAGLPLFTAFELQTQERLGRLAAEQARQGEAGEIQRARWRTAQYYLGAVSKQGALEAARERIRLGEEDVAAAERLKSRGLVLGSDFLAAEAILAGLRAWEAGLAGELAVQRAGLASVTGLPDAELSLSTGLAEPAYAAPPLEELGRAAARRRPDASSARLSVQAAEAAARRERWSLLPRVEAFAALETNSGDFSSGPSSRLYGARASLPFGDAAFFARRRGAERAADAGRAQERRALEDAALQVAQAHAGLKAAQAALPAMRLMSERAAASAAAFRPLYREGRQSVLDVLRAHEAAAKARAAYLDALAQTHAAYAGLFLAAGALDAAPLADISRGLEARP